MAFNETEGLMMKALIPALFFGTLALSIGKVTAIIVAVMVILLLNNAFVIEDDTRWD